MKRDPAKTINLDALDFALIKLLQEDGRLPLTELGSRLHVSHGTVRNRLERLLDGQVVRIVAVVDPVRVGFPTQVLIGINTDLRRMLAVEKELVRFEEVYFVSTISGRLDFLVAAVFASDAHLRKFLAYKLSKLQGVRATETFHILNMGKRLWRWQIPVTKVSAG